MPSTPLWRHVVGVLAYWTLAFATLIGSVFVAFDTAGRGWLGFAGMPLTAWWTMRFLWRLSGGPIAVSSPSI